MKKMCLLICFIFLFLISIQPVSADHCTDCWEEKGKKYCGMCGYGCAMNDDNICVENKKMVGSDSSGGKDWENICSSDEDVKQAFKIAGYVVQLARWIVPLILIVLGMVDFGKAAISSDDKAISKATAALVRRFIAGVVVFFIPTIVLAILNVIDITNGIEEESDTTFGQCTKCLFDPSDTSCPVKKS